MLQMIYFESGFPMCVSECTDEFFDVNNFLCLIGLVFFFNRNGIRIFPVYYTRKLTRWNDTSVKHHFCYTFET